MSVRALHDASGIPQKYLARVMRGLEEADLVEVSRGKYGGYRLARAPSSIYLSEIVEAVEGPAAFTDCFLGMNSCPLDGPCRLHAYWAPIRSCVQGELSRLSLAAIVDGAGFLDKEVA